jgi:hypothetical protein
MYRGDDATFTITPSVALGEKDVAVWTAKASLADLDDDAVLTAATWDDTLTATEDDKIEVTVAAEDTEDIEVPTRLYWDVQGNIDGKNLTLATGSLDIMLDVTRSNPMES